MRPESDRVAEIAARQHGRISRTQLLGAGVCADRVTRWVADGRLRRVHRGVYALGHTAPSQLADYMAAVLAAGIGAVLSHLPAGHVLRLLRGRPTVPEVTIPTTAGRSRPGIVIHRAALPSRDVFVLSGIPITTVPRALLDLTPRLTAPVLTRACHEAWIHHRTTPNDIRACIDRNAHKPGAAKLLRAVGADVTLSDLEEAFVALLRQHDLPLPRTNIDHAGDKVDCHWPALGLTVELVTFRYHATRQGFEQDVARRRRSGHVAYTWGDVFERPDAMIADLRPRLTAQPALHAAPQRSSSC